MSSFFQPIKDETCRDYLLERLPPEDLEPLDIRLIEDDTFAEQLSAAEDDLISDYLDGALAAEEIAAFQKIFLASPERRRSLIEISDLRVWARSEDQRLSVAAVKNDFAAEKKGLFRRPLILIPAFGVLLLGLLVSWQLLAPEKLTPLEQEFTARNKNGLADISNYSADATVTLSAGTLRDSSSVPRLDLGALSDPMLFRLSLPRGQDISKGFAARVYLGNRRIFTVNDVPAHQNTSGQELRMLLPRSILLAGQYQLRVENKASGVSTNYSFIIN